MTVISTGGKLHIQKSEWDDLQAQLAAAHDGFQRIWAAHKDYELGRLPCYQAIRAIAAITKAFLTPPTPTPGSEGGGEPIFSQGVCDNCKGTGRTPGGTGVCVICAGRGDKFVLTGWKCEPGEFVTVSLADLCRVIQWSPDGKDAPEGSIFRKNYLEALKRLRAITKTALKASE